eukprot:maker-scaffold85_size395806-snap-gene-1.18 protein:Tk03913 transcript:maker-scaffold85_size395806-snap-gene-1.18-mRNA-1 annotation:"hypothetical protein CISIN_1g032871mg"
MGMKIPIIIYWLVIHLGLISGERGEYQCVDWYPEHLGNPEKMYINGHRILASQSNPRLWSDVNCKSFWTRMEVPNDPPEVTLGGFEVNRGIQWQMKCMAQLTLAVVICEVNIELDNMSECTGPKKTIQELAHRRQAVFPELKPFTYYKITQDELKSFLSAMGNVGALAEKGIRLGNEKYMYISGSDMICRGKKGTGGLHAAKSKTTLVIGIYDDGIQPGQAAIAVEKMAEYLSGQNY